MNLPISGMGGDIIDLNHDGILDYCLSDTGPVKCLVRLEDGNYYDYGLSLNMVPEGYGLDKQWSAWSLEIADLDNDGWVDIALAAGEELHPRLFWSYWNNNFDPPENTNTYHVDTLLWGQPDGTFEDQAAVIGFDTTEEHYGLVTADMDGDGFPEILNLPGGKGPDYWQNTCGEGNWVTFDLVGDASNREAINAKVTVEIDGVSHSRQVQAIRALAQGPSVVHFGLGEATQIDSLLITWPDGTQSFAENLPVNRVFTVQKAAAP